MLKEKHNIFFECLHLDAYNKQLDGKHHLRNSPDVCHHPTDVECGIQVYSYVIYVIGTIKMLSEGGGNIVLNCCPKP